MDKEKELDFDPLIPVADALKKWWLAAIAALAAGLLAFVYTEGSNIPRYTVACTVAIYARGSEGPVPSAGMARGFAEVVSSPVIAALEEPDGIPLEGRLWAQVLEQTNFVTLTATAARARQAMDAMELVLREHSRVTREAVGELTLEIVEPPVLPGEPDPMQDPKAVFQRAALISFVAVFALMVAYYGTRDRVRSSEEAMRKLCCPCLARLCRRSRRNGNRWEGELDKLARRVDQMLGGGILLLTAEEAMDPEIPAGLARHLECRGREVGLADQMPTEPWEGAYLLVSLPLKRALEQLDRVDGVLLLVRHDHTGAKDANRAAADLERGNARFLGCILWDCWSSGLFDGGLSASRWYRGRGAEK